MSADALTTIFISGGADLQSIIDMEPSTYQRYVEVEYDLFRAIETLPFLTIAALRGGSCIGNAAEIALACDFRIAADNIRIGWPEVHVGFVAPAQRLARFVGIGQAKNLLFTGKLLSAQQAADLGLLSQVVTSDEVDAAVKKLAEQSAKRAPISIKVSKLAVERAYTFPEENPSLEIAAALESYATEDCKEGARAILEKRAPNFLGR